MIKIRKIWKDSDKPARIAIVLATIVTLWGGYRFFSRGAEDRETFTRTLLVERDTTKDIMLIDAKTRLQWLRDDLMPVRNSIWETARFDEGRRTQTRLFYAAGLITLLTSWYSSIRKGRKATTKDTEIAKIVRTQATTILFLAAAFVAIMYLLDIHFLDMIHRGDKASRVIQNTLDSLEAIRASDTTFYGLDKHLVDKMSDTLSTFCESVPRKLSRAIRPSIEAEVFYFIPFILLCAGVVILRWRDNLEKYLISSE